MSLRIEWKKIQSQGVSFVYYNSEFTGTVLQMDGLTCHSLAQLLTLSWGTTSRIRLNKKALGCSSRRTVILRKRILLWGKKKTFLSKIINYQLPLNKLNIIKLKAKKMVLQISWDFSTMKLHVEFTPHNYCRLCTSILKRGF